MTFSVVDLVNFRYKLLKKNSFSSLKPGRDTVATEELCSKNLRAKAHAADLTENQIQIKAF